MCLVAAVALWVGVDTTLHKPRSTPRETLADTTSIARAVEPCDCPVP